MWRMWICLGLLGCQSENTIQPQVIGETPAPLIAVTPTSLSFEAPLGQVDQELVTVRNDGDAVLELRGAAVSGGAQFGVENVPATQLEPGEELSFSVNFNALVEQDRGSVLISSNDPTAPEVQVDLIGEALTPLLLVEPNPIDFGSRTVGCTWRRPADLTNIGDVPLTVETVLASGGADSFALADGPDLPVDLEPGESVEIGLTFSPLQALTRSGQLLVSSNEPAGQQQITLIGSGAEAALTEQSYRQGKEILEQVDIIFYIDESGSMGDDRELLQANAARFMTDLQATSTEYQVMVVTEDSGCHNQTIITPNTANPADVFVRALDGQEGVATERGLTILRRALEVSGIGQCNAGFLREGVPLSAVLVSDEEEQSLDGWRVVLEEILEIEPEITISAIVGDVPGGCSRDGTDGEERADPGDGYVQSAQQTGGIFLSLCAEDWGPYVDALTDISTEIDGDATDTFFLKDFPDPATLVVTVDGAEVTNWSYDADLNAIVFDTLPPDDAEIFVTFTRGCGF